MKAIILIGGYGTRLRPLTLTTPKPFIEFCNRPLICYQLEALKKADVDVVVMAVNYDNKQLRKKMVKLEKQYGLKIIISKENQPMGTAGAIALARQHLTFSSSKEPMFIMNSDIICDFQLTEMLHFHQTNSADVTIATTSVNDPSKYGVIKFDSENSDRIVEFIEKPQQFISSQINAGVYLLNQNIIELIPVKPTSIEREIFPNLVLSHNVFSFKNQGIWMDVGQPVDYLTGVSIYLSSRKTTDQNGVQKMCENYEIIKNVLIHPSAIIEENCKIGPNVVIGKNSRIGSGSYICNSVILKNTCINKYNYISDSIIGQSCSIGSWTRIENNVILGDNVSISDTVHMNGCKVLPHKVINMSLTKGEIIM